MKNITRSPVRIVKTIILVGVLCGATGCSNLDLLGRKLDMASERVGTAKPVYEGHLQSAKHVGAMVALRFADGKDFDVAECPSTLVPGDVVRIYQVENGLAAHLWRDTPNQLKS